MVGGVVVEVEVAGGVVEAELPYATLAMVTDYDCWHETHEAATVEAKPWSP